MTIACEVGLIGALFVIVFLITLTVCLSIEGKPFALQLSVPNTPMATGVASFIFVTLFDLYGYYDYAGMQALGIFFLALYLMNWACLWWIFPGARARLRERRGGIAVGILLSVVCLALLLFLLRSQSLTLFDLVNGPQIKQGVVQDLDLFRIKGSVRDGILVVDGVRYRVPDMSWFAELSVEQSVEFLYGPETGLAFAADQNHLTLLALSLIAGLLGTELLVILLAALVPGANRRAPTTVWRLTGTELNPRRKGSLLRAIQERQRGKAERAKQKREC